MEVEEPKVLGLIVGIDSMIYRVTREGGKKSVWSIEVSNMATHKR